MPSAITHSKVNTPTIPDTRTFLSDLCYRKTRTRHALWLQQAGHESWLAAVAIATFRHSNVATGVMYSIGHNY